MYKKLFAGQTLQVASPAMTFMDKQKPVFALFL